MSTPSIFRIEGELTIYRAAELAVGLKAALEAVERDGVLELDLAGVTEMDSAGVQLLLAARRTAREGGRALALSGHSPAVREVFDTLQLAHLFGDELATAN